MRAILVCALVFFSGGASGASFDCRTATTSREKLICSDEGLSELDSQLANLYNAALGRLSENGMHTLVDEQRAWLHLLANACPLRKPDDERDRRITLRCLNRLYEMRIEDLKQTGIRFGPFLFTATVSYQAISPRFDLDPELKPSLCSNPMFNLTGTNKEDCSEDSDESGIAGRWISILQTKNPRIDSPHNAITSRWNAMNVHHINTNDERSCAGRAPGGDDGVTYTIGFANARLISVKWESYGYCHGMPHPFGENWTETLVMLPEPHALQATDLFRSDRPWKERLIGLVTAAVRKAWIDEGGDPANLASEQTARAACDPKHWLIDSDGLRVVFSSYELAGYSFAPTIVIAWPELKDVMADDPPVF